MPKILCVMGEKPYQRVMSPERIAELNALGDVTLCLNGREMSEEEYGALWEDADAAVTGWGVRAPTPAILDRAQNLRIISHTAGSVKMMPRYALEKGIVITSARAAISRTVAEFCLMNTLVLLRRLLNYVDADPARKAFYAAGPDSLFSGVRNETLYNKTVGLIGYGAIGRWFRRLVKPFGCRVLVHDPFLSEDDAAREEIERVDLPTLLRESKVVSVHAPDIPETRNLIGAGELALLQNGAVFLNSARGRIVDTEALTAALQTGRFFAAIDVTEPEPLPDGHPLRSLPNVLFTPHIAGPTEDELPELARMALNDLARFLRGEPPLYPISLEAYDLMSF